MRLFFIAFALSAAFAAPALAQLYSCTNADGDIAYSSVPVGKNCQLLKSYEKDAATETVVPAVVPAKPQTPPKKNKKQPAAVRIQSAPANKFVAPATQRQRDDKRLEILLYELRREKRIIGQIDGLIAATNSSDETDEKRRANLRRKRDIHILNIKAIRQELARL